MKIPCYNRRAATLICAVAVFAQCKAGPGGNGKSATGGGVGTAGGGNVASADGGSGGARTVNGGAGGTQGQPTGGSRGVAFDDRLPTVPEEGDWTSCVGDWPAMASDGEIPAGVKPSLELKGWKQHNWVDAVRAVPLSVGGRLATAFLQPVVFNEAETDVIFANIDEPGYPSTLAGFNDTSFFGSRGRAVVRLTFEAERLTTNWKYLITDPMQLNGEYFMTTWPVISPTNQVFFGGVSGLVYALNGNADSGQLLWKSAIHKSNTLLEPTVRMGAGDTIVVQWAERRMYPVSTKDGTPRGRFRTADTLDVMIDFVSPRLGFVGHTEKVQPHHIVFFDKCGKETRRIEALPDEVPILALSGGRILTEILRYADYTEDGGRILNPDGTEAARLDTKYEAFNPLAEGADGTIYSLSCDGRIKTGPRLVPKLQAHNERLEVVRSVEMPFLKNQDSDIYRCPEYYPLLKKDGVLTLMTRARGVLVAHFQTGSQGLSSGDWPTRLGNASNGLWAKTIP